jgi:hypothetical protein
VYGWTGAKFSVHVIVKNVWVWKGIFINVNIIDAVDKDRAFACTFNPE